MRLDSFLRLLNYKIKQYEKVASDTHKENKRDVTVIWVENQSDTNNTNEF